MTRHDSIFGTHRLSPTAAYLVARSILSRTAEHLGTRVDCFDDATCSACDAATLEHRPIGDPHPDGQLAYILLRAELSPSTTARAPSPGFTGAGVHGGDAAIRSAETLAGSAARPGEARRDQR